VVSLLATIGLIVGIFWAAARLADWAAGALRLPPLRPGQLLVVRARGDEAGLLLITAQAIAYMVTFLWGRQGTIEAMGVAFGRRLERLLGTESADGVVSIAPKTMEFYRESILPAALLVNAGLAFLLYQLGPSYRGLALLVVALPILILVITLVLEVIGDVVVMVSSLAIILSLSALSALIVAPALILLGLAMIPIAIELAPISVVLDATVEGTPPGRWEVVQVPSDPNQDAALLASTLMHSAVYEDAEALDAVAVWISSKCSLKRASR
jgi:hypothetical protein